MRMGPHVNTPHRASVAADYIRRVRPDACKMLDSGWSQDVVDAARGSGTKIIGRYYWDDQKLGAEHGRFIARSVGFAVAQGVDWMEGCNEDFQHGEELARYAEAEIERMKALERAGKVAVIGCFSTGQPQLGDWRYFRPALEYAAVHGHILGLHEYSGPVMQWMAGGNQVTSSGNVLIDSCDRPSVEGWLTLRYRKALALFHSWGIGNIKIVITESGIDDVNPRPGPQGKGYKSYYGTAYQSMSPFGDFASQMGWYGRRLTEDTNVVGWTDFGFSQAGDWETFDLSSDPVMLARVESEMLRLPRGTTGVGGGTGGDMDAVLAAMLKQEFGSHYEDLRTTLASNPNGPNGPFGPLAHSRVDGIAVHHTAAPKSTTWQSVASYHVNTRGFAGIGYHIGIRHGVVSYIGDIGTARAHVGGENDHLVGVCVAGDYRTDDLDPADADKLSRTLAILGRFLGRPVTVAGHKDFSPPGHTVCPGAAIEAALGGSPATPGLEQALLHWADLAQAEGIQPNPGAALYRAATRDGFYPLTDESGARGVVPFVSGHDVVAQLFRQVGGAEERVYYWLDGQVGYVTR